MSFSLAGLAVLGLAGREVGNLLVAPATARGSLLERAAVPIASDGAPAPVSSGPAEPSASPVPGASPVPSASPVPGPSPGPTASPTTSPASPSPGVTQPAAGATARPSAAPSPTRTATLSGTRSDRTQLRLRTTITGNIAPKSVRSSGNGLVSAHNMMYRHSVTLYDADRMRLVATIPDRVRLSTLGYPEYPEPVSGAPVEGAFSPDGRYLYVSNYAMYGPGFGEEGTDTCRPSDGYDEGFVYRIRLRDNRIDAAYRVGVVPKVVEVSADGRLLLVSNWCSWDVSVVDLERQREVRRVPIGAYPRGIVITGDSRRAYIAQMGSSRVVDLDLRTWRQRSISVGMGPRTVLLSPDARRLYSSLNAEGRVVAVDPRTRRVLGSARTGAAPRSMDIAPDGASLYVVNYRDNTLSKIATDSMRVTQTVNTCERPIGVTYEPTQDRVWVACYSGTIEVYDNR